MRPWNWRIAAFAVIVAVHVGFSAALGPVITAGLAGVTSIAMMLRARSLRGGPRAGVIAMAVALASNAVADTMMNAWPTLFGAEAPYPGPPDLFYLAFYPVMGGALAWLVKLHSKGRDRTAMLDATIVTVGAGVVLWTFLIVPLGTDSELGLFGRAVSVGYPMGDLLLLAMTVRVLLLGAKRTPALRLLIGALAMLFVADIAYLWGEMQGTYSIGAETDVLYDLSYGLFIAAAWHGSFRELLVRGDQRRDHTRWGRLAMLTAATLLAPAVASLDATASTIVPISASALMFLLVMARVGGLMQTVQRSNTRRFESLVRHSTDFVMVVDRDGAMRYCGPSTVRALGLTEGPRTEQVLDHVHPDDAPHVRGALAGCPALLAEDEHGQSRTVVEARLRTFDGEWRTFELTVTDLIDDADVGGLVINGHDIHDLRRLASFDQLTGLLNRAELTRRLSALLATDEPHSLLLYDLDGFKEINDSLGHAAGDAVLKEVGARLRALVRKGDVVARLGGDEFAVVTGGGDAFVTALAERSLVALGEPIVLGELAVSVEASVGIAERRPEIVDAHQLLRNADLAMYAAKGAGKGRAVAYDDAMGERVLHHVELRTALQSAVTEGQLELHYQPVFRLDTGALEGFEALLRWRHPQRGWISPAEFIPAAEESNQIIAIGRWVLDQACRQLAQWRRLQGGGELTMAVNLSPRQLADNNLVADVRRIVDDAGLPPHAVCLEITEGAVVDNATVAARVLGDLREIGVQLAIDDYGSGNASINYLRQFAVNTLKVDRSLVEHLDEEGTSRAIVRSIIELATALGLTTVGEGIETDAQRDALTALGCTIGQGYLLARPADPVATTRLVKSVLHDGVPST